MHKSQKYDLSWHAHLVELQSYVFNVLYSNKYRCDNKNPLKYDTGKWPTKLSALQKISQVL